MEKTKEELIKLKGFLGGCLFRDNINYRTIENDYKSKHIGIKVKDDKDLNFQSLIDDEYVKYYPINELSVVTIDGKETIVRDYHNGVTTSIVYVEDILNNTVDDCVVMDYVKPLKEILEEYGIDTETDQTIIIEPSQIGIGKPYKGCNIEIDTPEELTMYMQGFHQGCTFRDQGFYSKLAKEENKFYIGIKTIDDETVDYMDKEDFKTIKFYPIDDLTLIDTSLERALVTNYHGDVIIGKEYTDVINDGKPESVLNEEIVVDNAEKLKDYLLRNKDLFDQEINFEDKDNYRLLVVTPEQLGIIKDNKNIYRFNKNYSKEINEDYLRKYLFDSEGNIVTLQQLLVKLNSLKKQVYENRSNISKVMSLNKKLADVQLQIEEYFPEYNESDKKYILS